MTDNDWRMHLDKVGTFTTITVNGKVVSSVDNLYRTYHFDLKNYLEKDIENTITIRIDSTVR